ncbi:MAG: hypothetical protein K9N47_04540 [Prosthecobacter sp.]|nr:hypothetical protein [Prosthecobacter sp.]
MSDAAPSSNPGKTHAAQPGQGSGGWLADATALLATSVGDGTTEPWSLDALGDRQVADQALIEPWIATHGLCLAPNTFQQLLLGGTEHDVEFVERPVSHVRRVTKPTDEARGVGYGYTPVVEGGLRLGPASLGEYLRRLMLLNEVFPDVAMALEGFIRTPQRLEVVTLQEYVPGRLLGDIATEVGGHEVRRLIEGWFTRRGFAKLYLSNQPGPSHAWYREEDNTAVFDAKPANLLEWAGSLRPIDVNPVHPAGALLRAIRAAL